MIAQLRPRWHRWIFLPLLALVGSIGCWVCGEAILIRAGAWLDIAQPPVRSDYVLVLPGGPDTRPYVAAALAKAGYADEVILLKCRVRPDDLLSGYPPGHEIEQRVLLSRGLPAARVSVLETASESTFSDAECLRSFLAEQTDATATVVTNDYHTRRARFAFSTVFSNELPKLRFVSAPTDRFSAADWWRHKRGILAYVGEYLKLTFYFFRYGRGVVWTALMVAVGMSLLVLHRVRSCSPGFEAKVRIQ